MFRFLHWWLHWLLQSVKLWFLALVAVVVSSLAIIPVWLAGGVCKLIFDQDPSVSEDVKTVLVIPATLLSIALFTATLSSLLEAFPLLLLGKEKSEEAQRRKAETSRLQ